ncbi:amidohydrolase family protein [Actinomadura sp. LD22]|uniref:Amidohydrolase family protein n=1 Tax=Actinomadura physcomitrii TaxID=2650748 RepID=A0A6I4MPI0_9ACTN|nr:D-aminoacylase [Actinomadura physcomitrii]MWA05984.1 amidohydrolase family protein [Actinomadura physcomitrii]
MRHTTDLADDVVITGGEVVDGTGAPARRADVVVREGRIQDVVPPGKTHEGPELDATGLVVAPGFIDLHSHADFTVQEHPAADTAVHQGVTTLLGGNCGFSPFPVAAAEELRGAAGFLASGVDFRWTDLDGYARAVDADRPAVNLATQVGHLALRTLVMGPDERPATADELAAMRSLLAAAAEQGAFGFSTGLIYAPGSYASSGEVAALAAEAARHGLLYSTHMRNESDELLEAVDEALDAARRSEARLEISHLKAMGPANHGKVGEALARIEAARAEGVDAAADVYPYTASSTTLTSRLPGWAMDGGAARLLERLMERSTRDRIAAGLRARFGRDVDPAGVVVAELPDGPYSRFTGRSLTEIGAETGMDPAEAALELLAAHDATVSIVNHAMSAADVAAVLAHPLVSVASDGWTLAPSGAGRPHPRSFGTFARVLGRYVRGDRLLTLPEAVRKMTSLPAARLGLADRGELRAGRVADIAVFDPAAVTDTSDFADPWRLATGVRHVLVRGVPVLRDGTATGARPGRVLRRVG